MTSSNHRSPTAVVTYRPWIHRLAILLAAATFLLLITGGNVTSKGAGLAVPDWPNSFGYNMFTFPVSKWFEKQGVADEHIHRLKGTLVGFLCIAMTITLWFSQKNRSWLRWLGLGLLGLVIVQGVMGGLRVTEISTFLAILHGITGQLFFCLTVLVAAATGKWWMTRAAQRAGEPLRTTPKVRLVRQLGIILLLTVVVQLTLGAVMRHLGAGLAIPDFPAAYGGWVPPMNQQAIDAALTAYTQSSGDAAFKDATYSPTQVGVHFAHRVVALLVVIFAGWTIHAAVKTWRREPALRRLVWTITVLLLIQVILGAMVIWTGRHPHVATTHQAVGALTLACIWLLTIRMHLLPASPDGLQPAVVGKPSPNPQPAAAMASLGAIQA